MNFIIWMPDHVEIVLTKCKKNWDGQMPNDNKKSLDKMPTNHLAFCQLAFCPHTLIQPYQSSINTMSGKSIGRWVTIEIMIGLFSDRLAKLWFWGPCYFHWLCKLWTRGSCLHMVKNYADIHMHPLDMENYWLAQMTIHVFFTK